MWSDVAVLCVEQAFMCCLNPAGDKFGSRVFREVMHIKPPWNLGTILLVIYNSKELKSCQRFVRSVKSGKVGHRKNLLVVLPKLRSTYL